MTIEKKVIIFYLLQEKTVSYSCETEFCNGRFHKGSHKYRTKKTAKVHISTLENRF